MMEDLRVTKFNNGDPIIQLTSNNGWTSSICNNPNYYEYNNVVYYNLLTINDSRNVCPTDGLLYANDYEEILNLANKGFPSNNNGNCKQWDYGRKSEIVPTGFWDWTVNFNIPVSNISTYLWKTRSNQL